MVIEAKQVFKTFRNQEVLKDINLTVKDNEIFGLIGPSGAGKTTLIRLIIGAISADQGEIRVGNFAVPDLKVLRYIGYMPQNDAIYQDISGYDNLIFFGGMYGLRKGLLRKRAEEVLKLVELEQDAHKKVMDYSGGMKKRLSLAVAMLHSPEILILDEPTVGIDPILRKKIWEEFYVLKAQGKTIIVTTHVMDEAVKCDRLALIYNGGIIACDTVDELLGRTASNSIEELFLESGVNRE